MINSFSNSKVKTIHDSTKAYSEIISDNYDCIFLDIKMPNISGYDILESLKQNGKENVIRKIYLLTAIFSSDVKNDTKKYKIKGILNKPIQINEIKELLIVPF